MQQVRSATCARVMLSYDAFLHCYCLRGPCSDHAAGHIAATAAANPRTLPQTKRARCCRCVCVRPPPNRDTPQVAPERAAQLMAALPAWRLRGDGKALTRTFTAKNFVAAVAFFNNVVEVAEAEGHHPDLHLTNYR